MQSTYKKPVPQKKSANLSINSDLLKRARASKINLSRALEECLTEILRQEERETWLAENAEAICGYNARVAEEGVFSDGLRGF